MKIEVMKWCLEKLAILFSRNVGVEKPVEEIDDLDAFFEDFEDSGKISKNGTKRREDHNR